MLNPMDMDVFLEFMRLWEQFDETRLNNPIYVSRFYGEFNLADHFARYINPMAMYENVDLVDTCREIVDGHDIIYTRITNIGATPTIRPRSALMQVQKSEHYLYLNSQGMTWNMNRYAVCMKIDWQAKTMDLHYADRRRGTQWAYSVIERMLTNPDSVSHIERNFVSTHHIFHSLEALRAWKITIRC